MKLLHSLYRGSSFLDSPPSFKPRFWPEHFHGRFIHDMMKPSEVNPATMITKVTLEQRSIPSDRFQSKPYVVCAVLWFDTLKC
jgi:hypothetical protein